MPSSYPAPRKNVLLLSCMDLRLLDDIVRFMHRDNLTNRYDQFILAGSSLGANRHSSWNDVLFQHIETAVELHGIKDVYILEHRHCGAYEKFLGNEGTFDDSPEGQQKEHQLHKENAVELANRIYEWCEKTNNPLNIRALLMDLRGEVSILEYLPASPIV
jgi:carbonic anhydrase